MVVLGDGVDGVLCYRVIEVMDAGSGVGGVHPVWVPFLLHVRVIAGGGGMEGCSLFECYLRVVGRWVTPCGSSQSAQEVVAMRQWREVTYEFDTRRPREVIWASKSESHGNSAAATTSFITAGTRTYQCIIHIKCA